MNDGFEFTLHDPLTKEDWERILDVEHENTTSVVFQTPQGRQVKYIKSEVLDKIRAEIENDWQFKEYPSSPFSCGLRRAIEIIDKYKAKSEE